MRNVQNPPADYDGAWKEALEQYWQPFLTLCFPRVAAAVDWSRPVKFLDKELQDLVRDAASGRRFVDKLVEVAQLDGRPQWVLVHVEVQSDPDRELPARMFQYHYRVIDRFRKPVVSLAVLADDQVNWRPGAYEAELWGCRVCFEYPVCKLLSFDESALERCDNRVAWVIAAHRAAQRTVREAANRAQLKMQLVRRLYEGGISRQDVLNIFRLIDWMMTLPVDLEKDFQRKVLELEKAKVMPYVTSMERLSRQEGLQTGLQEGLEKGLEKGRIEAGHEAIREALLTRFSQLPPGFSEALSAVSDPAELRQWLRWAITVPSIEAFIESIKR